MIKESIKDNFIELGQDKDGFEIMDPKKAPDGLTAEILWNLWDIGSKFGMPTPKRGQLAFAYNLLAMEVYDFRGNGIGGTTGFFIAKRNDSHLALGGMQFFDLKNGMMVMWNMAFSVKEVVDLISVFDKFCAEEGLMEDGKRQILFNDLDNIDQSPEYVVDNAFKNKGAIMLVSPLSDPAALLAQFDHPELLAVISAFEPLYFLCLEAEKDNIVVEMTEKLKKAKELGFTPEDIGGMSVEDILELREKL